jgi:dimethylhistidine N-methyltransferase
VVLCGLSSRQKWLPPILFYDDRGSQLFEEICGLDEYYVTRTERAILLERASELARIAEDPCTVFELGCGNSEKTALLLRPLARIGALRRHIALDISSAALNSARVALGEHLPSLDVITICSDYRGGVGQVRELVIGRLVTLLLGGNIGNYDLAEAGALLEMVRGASRPGDLLVVGADRPKDPAILVAAYDDARRVTAQFNLNVLHRLNRELGATFEPANFEHLAAWNQEEWRIEMHLRSTRDQVVWIEKLQQQFQFRAGETIHTESCYKLPDGAFEEIARRAGWTPRARWVDREERFAVHVLGARA